MLAFACGQAAGRVGAAFEYTSLLTSRSYTATTATAAATASAGSIARPHVPSMTEAFMREDPGLSYAQAATLAQSAY